MSPATRQVEILARKHLLLARDERMLSAKNKCAPSFMPADWLECPGDLVDLFRRVATTG